MTTVKLKHLSNDDLEFSDSQMEYLLELSKKLEKIVNSEIFKTKIIQFKYKRGRRVYNKFRLNKGFSNAKIFYLLLSGKDLYSEPNNSIDIYLKPYIRKSKIHATTFSGVRSIFLNIKYLDTCIKKDSIGLANLAGTLIHEYTHIMGFRHYTNRGKKRDKPTVPWGVGNTIKKLVKNN